MILVEKYINSIPHQTLMVLILQSNSKCLITTIVLVILILFSGLNMVVQVKAQTLSSREDNTSNILPILRAIKNTLSYIRNKIDRLYKICENFAAAMRESFSMIISRLSALENRMLGLEKKIDMLQKALDELKTVIDKLQPISIEQAEKIARLLQEAKAIAESLVYIKWLQYLVMANFILNLLTLLVIIASS